MLKMAEESEAKQKAKEKENKQKVHKSELEVGSVIFLFRC